MAIRRNNNGNGGTQSRGAAAGGNQGGDGGDGGGDDGGGDDGADLDAAVNAAVTAHLGRKLPSILGPLLTKAVEAAVAPLRATLEGLGQGNADQGNADQGGEGQGGGKGAGKGAAAGQQNQGAAAGQDPQVKALMGQVSALTEQLKRQQEQTVAQETEGRNARRDAMLTESLTKLGVDKNRLRGAMAIARDATTWDPEAATPTGGKGAWVWRAQRNGYTEDLAIDVGLGEWGKTDEGKSYIAAQPQLRTGGGGGHGTQQQRVQAGGRQQAQDPAANRQANAQAGAEKLFGQVSEMLGGGVVQLGGGGGG